MSMKFITDILQSADGANYDLFHFAIVLAMLTFIGLEIAYSAAHGWTIDSRFGTDFVLLVGGGAASFPIRDWRQQPKGPGGPA